MATAAIAVVVWLALSYRSERLETQAARVAFGRAAVNSAEAEEALRRAREARTVQPDTGPQLLEWILLARRGRDREALGLLQQIVRAEPANARAWFLLAEHARDADLADEARRRFSQLRPPPHPQR